MDLVSKQTRISFREQLVAWTLARISDAFDAADVLRGELPPDLVISGQRRALVEEYYAGVDWSSRNSVIPVLRVFEDVLASLQSATRLRI